MKTLLKNTIFLVAIAILLTSCSREDVSEEKAPVPPPKYKLATSTYTSNGVTENSSYSYTDNGFTITSTFSDQPGKIYTSVRAKEGNFWTMTNKKDGVTTYTAKFFMTGNGNIDSTAYFNSLGNLNSKSKYFYNANGYTDRNMVEYPTYKHDYTYHYADGNCTYWKNNFTYLTNPSSSKVDSIAFEYYPDLSFTTSYKPFPIFADGKQNKNLVKKKSYYNLTSGGLYLTFEYQYEVDESKGGLVTKEMINMYTQPGNVLYRNDEYNFTYMEE